MLFWVVVTIMICSIPLDVMEATLLLLVGVVMLSVERAVTASSGDFEVTGDGMMV